SAGVDRFPLNHSIRQGAKRRKFTSCANCHAVSWRGSRAGVVTRRSAMLGLSARKNSDCPSQPAIVCRILLHSLIRTQIRRPRGPTLMSRSFWSSLTALALSLALFATAAAQQAQGKKYALLVGVKEYKGANFSELKYPERDVEELATILTASG